MTIKGNLQVSIPIVKAFMTRNFLSPPENWRKICVLGIMGPKCKILFSGPPKGTSLGETTSFDVLIVIIGAGVLAVGCRKNKKNYTRVTWCAFSHIGGGAKESYRIVMKFCIGVEVPDVITQANLGDDRFRGFWGGRGSNFPLFHWLVLSLKHSGTTVPAYVGNLTPAPSEIPKPIVI